MFVLVGPKNLSLSKESGTQWLLNVSKGKYWKERERKRRSGEEQGWK